MGTGNIDSGSPVGGGTLVPPITGLKPRLQEHRQLPVQGRTTERSSKSLENIYFHDHRYHRWS